MTSSKTVVSPHQYGGLSYGTCRTNRIVWSGKKMSLKNKDDPDKLKVLYDRVNKVLCLWWFNIKVVNFVLTLRVLRLGNNL